MGAGETGVPVLYSAPFHVLDGLGDCWPFHEGPQLGAGHQPPGSQNPSNRPQLCHHAWRGHTFVEVYVACCNPLDDGVSPHQVCACIKRQRFLCASMRRAWLPMLDKAHRRCHWSRANSAAHWCEAPQVSFRIWLQILYNDTPLYERLPQQALRIFVY